ncbi:hypothetical protein [Cryobacterium sp. PH31-O1]|uniref:fibronectin type III domain-containing protein n=1 Tax=Cryobacterium sp. PH31-O1 TaxID=3046306 RepID=UPI0024BBA198|nr:hypothetical protein [Cryobacterium sp. PH31-O1]MDJ0338571.1 hypothetical protein [Cryobacterium sp. PH31-O1]
MTRPQRFRSRRQRTAALLGTVLFLVLAASGAAHAAWTTAAVQATGSVASNSVTIGQSGFDQLKFDYTSTALVATKPITLTNGAVPSSYTLTLVAATSTPAALAGAITVTTWPVAAAVNCTPGAALPGNQTVHTWSSGTTLTGPLPASASIVYCVRTSMSSPIPGAYIGGQVAARLNLSAVAGTNWKTAIASVTVVQAVADSTPPTAPTNLNDTSTTDASATLSWTAATDNVGVASYRVYRDRALIRSGITGTTFTDTGLNVGTTYTYTVDALDAAGNASVKSSDATAATSSVPSSTGWYRVKSGLLCVTGPSTANAAVTIQVCNDALTTQLWQYDLINQSEYLINSQAAAGLVWQRTSSRALVVATRNTNDSSQQWGGMISGNGLYQFTTQVNRNKTECIAVPSYTAGTALQTQNCAAVSAQQFTLTAVN